MKIKSIVLLMFILFFISCASVTEKYPTGDGLLDPREQNEALGKGVNFGNLLDAFPREGSWSNGYVMQERDFQLAKAAGFDSVRIPIRFSLYAKKESPYTIVDSFFARVDEVVNWGLENDLIVIIDMHHYEEIMKNPDGHSKRFIGMWQQIASRYKDYPKTLYFEILNEPNSNLDGETWNRILYDCLFAIRKIDKYHTVIIGCPQWSNISGLTNLKIPEEEKNIIVTFHYYTPHLFCFQGREWAGPTLVTTGITWPGPPAIPIIPPAEITESPEMQWVEDWIQSYNTITNPRENPAGPGIIEREIAYAAAWGKDNNYPMWMSEFCAQKGGDIASRAAWTEFVRLELEKYNIPWSIWSLLSDSGSYLYDRETNEWETELTDALGLDVSGL